MPLEADSMANKAERVMLIGGPGKISRGTVDYLRERGAEIAICTRNSESKCKAHPDVTFYEAPRGDGKALATALEDFGARLVIDTICFDLEEAELLYNIVRDRIDHLIFVSTVDTYGYPLSRIPFRESDTFRPAIGSYAQKKRVIEEFYEEKHATEGFPVTIGRPSLSIAPSFCPMMFFDWGHQAVSRMKAGKPIMVPGDGNGLMHVGWAYDVGRMLGRMIGDRVSLGKGYTLSDENCLPRDEYIDLFAAELAVEPQRVYIPQEYIESFLGVDQMQTIYHLYRVNMAFSLERFKADFPDYEWLPLHDGVREFIRENERGGTLPDPNVETIEDRIIAEWRRRLAGWGGP